MDKHAQEKRAETNFDKLECPFSSFIVFFARPLNLADVCILRSGVNAKTTDCWPSNDLTLLINRSSGETDCVYEANVK